MAKKAIIVGMEQSYVVVAEQKQLVPNKKEFLYDAEKVAFILANKQDIKGGIMFTEEAPSMSIAEAIVIADLSKVVYKQPALLDDQIKALELLKQYNIPTYLNTKIIL